MKVSQICVGRFHHFDLARQLSKRGLLERIFTGYPSWKIKDEGIPVDQLTSYPWVMAPYMGLVRWGKYRNIWQKDLSWLAHESLDRHVARHLPPSDWLIALSGSGLRSGGVAKSRGMHVVCDRGSSHIRFQNQILTDEYKIYGEQFTGVDPRMLHKEEAEYDRADFITVPSEFARRSFIEMGVPAEKVCKIPYGVDLRRFSKVGDPPESSFEVLFVGQISPRKGIKYLLEAFGRLKHPRKRLTIVGGTVPEALRYLQRNPPGEQVRFLGHQPQAQLKEIMSRSHAMVLPSIEEGLALVQAQAMACGCPVVATWNTGASDLFDDGRSGFIVQPRDVASIVDRLQQLADDDVLRRRMSESALAHISSLGGWDQYGDRFDELLQSRRAS